MIGFKKKFIFLHIPRTGGTSIEIFLKPNIEFLDQVTSEGDMKHFTMGKYYRVFGDLIKDFYKFTVVRNPWDRMLSYYFHLNHSFDEEKFIEILNLSRKQGVAFGGKFTDRVKGTLHYNFYSCCQWIHETKGDEVNTVKYENLNSGFDSICNDLKIDKGTLPWVNKRKRVDLGEIPPWVDNVDDAGDKDGWGDIDYSADEHYSKFYSKKTKQMVARAFADDIKAFGYKYEAL